MGLSDDQRALLRLLARREEGYEDIAALMGIGVDEVRARVREALTGLDEEGLAAGPVEGRQGAAAAGPVAAGDPPPPAVAEASSGAVPPATPPAGEAFAPRTAEPRPPRVAPSRSRPAPSAPARRLRLTAPRDRGRLAELLGGVAIVILIVLFATGAVDIGGDGGGSDSGTTTSASSDGGEGVAAGSGKLTQAILRPVDGGDAEGRALFGRIGKNVVLQVEAQGLGPTAQGEAYSVWLYRSPQLVLRVGAARVGANGKLAAQFPIPAELLGFVANGAFRQVAVSRLSEAEYRSALAAAKKRKRLPGYLGADALRGRITGPAVNS